MKIVIKTIPHQDQRYDTVGDWTIEEDGFTIRISDLGNIYEEVCVAVHELCEMMLCFKREISQYDVDKFDIEFESNRKPGDFSEPGDDPTAPYYKEHCFATTIEQMLAAEFRINWSVYEAKINSLEYTPDLNDHGE